MACFGELVQFDGSYHNWFECGSEECLLAAIDDATSLNDLFSSLKNKLGADDAQINQQEAHYADFRAGDILHSRADISKAKTVLGYEPRYTLDQGLDEALPWYRKNLL